MTLPPALTTECHDDDEIVACVTVAILTDGFEPGSAAMGEALADQRAYLKARERSRLITPIVLDWLANNAFDALSNRHRSERILVGVVRSQLRTTIGPLATFFLRWIIAKVVAWLIEWALSNHSRPWFAARAKAARARG